MAVEKYQFLSHESVPYTMLSTYVIQNIDNGDAYFIWSYLQSKPKDWKVIKEELKKHFRFGNDKLKSIFSYLVKNNLIKYEQKRDGNGKMLPIDIIVLNGEEFRKNHLESFKSIEVTTGVKMPPVDKTFEIVDFEVKSSIKSTLPTGGVKSRPPVNRKLQIKEKNINKKQIQKPPIVPLKISIDDIKKLELPEYVDEIEWHNFVDHRAEEMNDPLTLRSAKSIVRKLVIIKNEGGNPNIALLNAVGMKWLGPYNDNKTKNKQSQKVSVKKESAMESALRWAASKGVRL